VTQKHDLLVAFEPWQHFESGRARHFSGVRSAPRRWQACGQTLQGLSASNTKPGTALEEADLYEDHKN
jgi:hypothetical protein